MNTSNHPSANIQALFSNSNGCQISDKDHQTAPYDDSALFTVSVSGASAATQAIAHPDNKKPAAIAVAGIVSNDKSLPSSQHHQNTVHGKNLAVDSDIVVDATPIRPGISDGKTSFIGCLRKKYLDDVLDLDVSGNLIMVAPKSCSNDFYGEVAQHQLHQRMPAHIVLDDFNITRIEEDVASLIAYCSRVLELDVSHNHITCWHCISKLLHATPRLSFLNLSFNPLKTSPAEHPSINENWSCCISSCSHVSANTSSNDIPVLQPLPLFPHLSRLILNGTHTPWTDVVQHLLSWLPNLTELHVSLNDYDTLDIGQDSAINDSVSAAHLSQGTPPPDDVLMPSVEADSKKPSASECNPKSFPTLGCVNFDSNRLSDPYDICRIGALFPNISTLYLSSDPLKQFSDRLPADIVAKMFGRLAKLSLNHVAISDWCDIEPLAAFKALIELRVVDIPLISLSPTNGEWPNNEEEFRQHFIALLPNVKILNGSPISDDERETCERALLRAYMQTNEKATTKSPPRRFAELELKHGQLSPITHVDLSPKTTVCMRVRCGDKCELKNINVRQTVQELKRHLAVWCDMKPSRWRLFYCDAVMSPEELRYPGRRLHSYRMQDGDELVVEPK